MKKYRYDGPVINGLSKQCINERWYGETYAETERKAKSNIGYQYKKRNGYVASMRIDLPGDITEIEKEYYLD